MNNTILITGGLGYIGGRVVQKMSEGAQHFLRIVDLPSVTAMHSSFNNGDILAINLLEDNLDSICKGVQCIVHLAALNEVDSASNPEQALIVNGLGTLRLLHAAERAGVERFIYFSTAHVYGAPLIGRITEKLLPRPIHPYAITHRVAEDFVLSAFDKKTIIGIVLRLSNSFGPPASSRVNRWMLVVNDLCRQAITTKKLLLRSSGLQRRDFITLQDVNRAVHHFLGLPVEKCADGLFNLGGECSLRIIDMVELIAERCNVLFGYKPEVIRQTQHQEVTNDLIYSIEKLKVTGFKIRGDIKTEVDDTLIFCFNEFGEKRGYE